MLPGSYGRDISRGIISRQKSGLVGSRLRSGRPPRFFDKSGLGSGRPPQFFDKSGHVGMPYPEFSSIFPGHFRSEKNREKSREIGINRGNRDKLREIGENRGQSRLFLTYLELFKRSGWPSWLIPKCRDKSGRLKNPDLDFGSRLGRPPRSSSPISAARSDYDAWFQA